MITARTLLVACAPLALLACEGSVSQGTPADAANDGRTSGDAAPDATAALCARSGLVFCEDFEALPLGAATSTKWTTEAAAGTLTIDATHARGQHALKIATTGNGRGRLQVTGLAPAGNSLYGVAHVWVTGFPTAPDYAHFTMVELAGAGGGTLLRPIGGQYAPGSPAGSFWGVGSDGGPTGDWTNWRRSAPSEGGKWVCMEFQLAATDATISVWIDGVAHPELTVSRASHGGNAVDLVFPTIDRAWFGWWLYQANPTPAGFEVWLDDLALASTRLGCA